MCMCVCAHVPHAPLEELRGRRLGGSDFPWQLTFFPYFCDLVLFFSQHQTQQALKGLKAALWGFTVPSLSPPPQSPACRGGGASGFANPGPCKPVGNDRAFVLRPVLNKEAKEKENGSQLSRTGCAQLHTSYLQLLVPRAFLPELLPALFHFDRGVTLVPQA